MSNRTVITIDGLAATGKSSLARGLAKKLRFIHLNTGLLYRTLAYLFNEYSVDENQYCQFLSKLNLNMTIDQDIQIVEASSSLFERIYRLTIEDLQADEVSATASKIAVLSEVRKYLLPVQQNAFSGENLVAEGRDMGTVVFKDAEIKFFIEVPAEVRAHRRYLQLFPGTALGEENIEDKKQIEINILDRDKQDQERALAPCIPASDSILYENTAVSLTQAIEDLYNLLSQRVPRK